MQASGSSAPESEQENELVLRHVRDADSQRRLDDVMHTDRQRVFWQRPLQSLAVIHWALAPFACLFVFFMLCSIPLLWPVIVPYLIWVFFIDKAPVNGTRRSDFLRRSIVFRWIAEYFPVTLVKTAELPADRKYVLGYHPHGIVGMGAVNSFASEAQSVSEKFPGVRLHLLTLHSNFSMPLYRDYLMALGLCSVSRRSCESILRKGPGNGIVIVVGGAQESLFAHPGHLDLTLRRRMGFVKVAINQGADLVPVLGFGENEIFRQASNDEDTWLFRLQQLVKQLCGFTVPVIFGRGFSHRSFGLMPYMRPIHVVVGKPVHVVQSDNPTEAQLKETHGRYVESLVEYGRRRTLLTPRVWDRYKDEFSPLRFSELRIVD
ncbi:2-acylglycerol O-acyltransferase [Malassezia sp. CBS 17886]|nr:2-acylglycerol O-acyltransferase [Malassezia sp. CBS 17886]